MAKILVLRSSSVGSASVSNALVDSLLKSFKRSGHNVEVLKDRDLVADPVPLLNFELNEAVRQGVVESRAQKDAVKLADLLVKEIHDADTIIIGAPQYNFCMSVQLKTWLDFIIRPKVTFSYVDGGPKGAFTGKKVYVVATSGGFYKGTDKDIVVESIKMNLGLVGMTDVEVIYCEGAGRASQQETVSQAQKEVDDVVGKHRFSKKDKDKDSKEKDKDSKEKDKDSKDSKKDTKDKDKDAGKHDAGKHDFPPTVQIKSRAVENSSCWTPMCCW